MNFKKGNKVKLTQEADWHIFAHWSLIEKKPLYITAIGNDIARIATEENSEDDEAVFIEDILPFNE